MYPAAGSTILAAFLLAAVIPAASPAQADQRVHVRIGMSMSQIKSYLEKECTDLTIGGNNSGEQFITCELPQGRLITANLSAKDRITYSVYRETNDTLSAEQFGAAIAAELGFAGAGEPCMVYSNASLCWSRGTTKLWV
ncbi:MAG: hypothetical protein Q8S27_05405, partial [Hoeflea sp.]|nr:hypothetical protein [Hoeflea sp.]